MLETSRLQAKDRATVSMESTSQRCITLSGFWLEGRTFPGLTPWALLLRRFAAQAVKP
jgi:hypothetical protein